MSEFGNVAFDPETLAILEGVFGEGGCLSKPSGTTISRAPPSRSAF